MSIRAKIFLVFVAAVVAGFSLLAYWVAGDLRSRYSESFEEVMVDGAHLLAAQLAQNWEQPATDRFAALQGAMQALRAQTFSARIYSVEKTSADIRVYVTDDLGDLLYDSRPGATPGTDYSRWIDVARTLAGGYGARTSEEPVAATPGTVSVAYVAAPILVNGKLVGVVSLGKPKTNIQRFVDNARRKLIVAVLAASGVAIVLALLLYLWVSRPLQALVEYANDVGEGRGVNLPELGDNEIGRVGQAIEAMRKALEDKAYVETYVQSLTHEVKSPLTAIRATAELLAGEVPAERRAAFVKTIEREVDRLSEISDRLLELAALERTERLRHAEPVALHALAAEVVASTRASASARGVIVTATYSGRDDVRGDPLLLQQAIDNLLRNALDFSAPGETVALAASAENLGVTISVQDEGPGIPEYARERIFDRFYSLPRPGSGRKSTGLGLNFVREVAQLHGGSITIENPERGTLARLFIPWRPPYA
ncbi:MAG: two-component system sensor histidine kinase CreC [Steroidobacteraceae bacterium]